MSDREHVRRSRQRTASTINEVCERNHVGRDFIYRQIKAGRLKAKKLGSATRIFSDDEEAWQNSLPTLGGGEAA
jgi:excisionase family DNA binding protein